MKKIKFILLISIFLILILSFMPMTSYADGLDDTISEQLEVIDLSSLKDYYDNVVDDGSNFNNLIKSVIDGKFNLDFNSIFEYVLRLIFDKVFELMPTFLSILSISVFCGILNNLKSSFLGEGTNEIIFYVSFLSIILILSSSLISIFTNIKNTIKNLTKLNEIMSPIITSLMIASGGDSAVGIFKPSVMFLTSGVSKIFSSFLIPLVVLITIFSIISNFSGTQKLKKLSDSFSNIFKWVIGLIIAIFGIFITTSGIASFSFDSIKAKATKYLISTGVPIIGGFLRDGFDLVVAGSIVIKNAVGLAVIIMLFYTLIAKIIYMAAFSIMLKLTAAFIEPVGDARLSEFCLSINKSITYLTTCLISVGFMTFLTVLLSVISLGAI